MPKDRNTFAKRQREMEKKHKASKKRERRAQKKVDTDDGSPDAGAQQPNLTSAELKVLSIFRQFMMSPGRMLCFNSADASTYRIALASLSDKGLLIPEQHRDGYSLTADGFDAMQRNTSA